MRATLGLAPGNALPGATLEARVALEVARGHSINGHRPPTRDLYGLSLSVLESGDLEPGAPLFPPAANVPRRFSREPIAGYQGQATLTLPLRLPRGAAPGPRTLRVRLGFQACTESRCHARQPAARDDGRGGRAVRRAPAALALALLLAAPAARGSELPFAPGEKVALRISYAHLQLRGC